MSVGLQADRRLEEAELRSVVAFCEYMTTRSDYPENIEATANAFGADQFKGR
jgi:hypothetical protein